jgi:hypothetical protein
MFLRNVGICVQLHTALQHRHLHCREKLKSEMNPVHTLPPHSLKIFLKLSSHPLLYLPSGIFSSDFPSKTFYAFLTSFTCAICFANIIFLDLIILIILAGEYKLRKP